MDYKFLKGEELSLFQLPHSFLLFWTNQREPDSVLGAG